MSNWHHWRYYVLVGLVLCGAPAGAADSLIWPERVNAPPRAVEQSNAFATGHEISDPLLDGWQHAAFKCVFDREGRFPSRLAPSVVVDRCADPVLRKTITRARSAFGRLPPDRQAAELARFAHRSLHPDGLSWGDLSDWEDEFSSAHLGQRVLLGEFIKRRRGVCQHQAVLLKVLLDEFGLTGRLVFGYKDGATHIWTVAVLDGQETIFDPAKQSYGTPVEEAQGYRTLSQLYGESLARFGDLEEIADLDRQGKQLEAAEKLEPLVRIDEMALGALHPDYATSLETLARLYRDGGRHDKAAALLEQSLAISEKSSGSRHQQTADRLNALANLYAGSGRQKQAEALYRRAIDIYRERYGPGSCSEADVAYNLARLLSKRGDASAAATLFRQSAAIYRKAGAARRADLADAKRELRSLTASRKP